MILLRYLALLSLGLAVSTANAQVPMGASTAAEPQSDTSQLVVKPQHTGPLVEEIVEPKPHSPKTASILSMALPGLGQLYNRKYWKAPLVWGGLGAAAYFMVENRRMMRDMNSEFAQLYAAGSAPSASQIQERDRLRNNRDLAILGGTAFYALQIIDATVDAHFYKFDINQDLSLLGGATELRLCYRF
jgi:hypothetical protein